MARPKISAAHREAVLETTAPSSLLVPVDLRPQFVLIGSAAMVQHGFSGRVGDVDFVGSAEAHWAFLDAAQQCKMGHGAFSVTAIHANDQTKTSNHSQDPVHMP